MHAAGVAIISKGQLVYKKSFGYLNDRKEQNNDSALFNIASISKSITAWGVMKLAESGKINIDSPVNNYLKRWKAPSYKDDSVTIEITPKMLLSHTAGLSMSAVTDFVPGKPMPVITEELSKLKFINKPGTQFKYSGGGYMILQLLIEDVTGESFASYMKKNVLDPLGMQHSSFVQPTKETKNIATPYDETLQPTPYYSYVGVSAAGLYTSLDDLTKFVEASMEIQPNAVLKRSAIELMKTKVTNSYGLGYSFDEIDSALVLTGHGGAAEGWRAAYYFNDSGDAVIVMANSSFNDLTNATLCYWIKEFYERQSKLCEPSVYSSLLIDLFTKGMHATAERVKKIKQQTGTDPLPEFVCNILGSWMMRLERWKGAKTFFEFNTIIFPESADAFDSLGEFYEHSNENNKAIACYKTALKLDPSYQHAKSALENLIHNKLK